MLTEKIEFEADERILKQVRKHWFVLFVQFFGLFLVAIVPLAAYLFMGSNADTEAFARLASILREYFIFGYTAWLLLVWMAAFNVWTNYYLDVWTITSKRLIAVDQLGLFNRTVGSFRLERLQDMNTAVHGIIPTLLNFGTLEAQTAAGSEDEFLAHNLPDPQGLKAIILGATDELMRDYGRRGVNDGGV